jgi:hypothetical protein
MTNDSMAFSWLWDAIRRLLKAGNSQPSTLKNGWSIGEACILPFRSLSF